MLGYLTFSNLWALLTLCVDIAVMSVFIYYLLKIVRNNTRTTQIFKGVIFLFLLNGAAQLLSLKTVEYFTSLFMTWGMVAIIVIFQPEIRQLLEKVGKSTVFSRISTLTENEREKLVNELTKTCASLSNSKTGALITIEQGQSLSDYIKTGTPMNSLVSSELLCSIFQYGTPLHDGAVIIQGDKIACASAYFPPTTRDFPSTYGARHRAAVGISEISDCVTIVCSEESGNISIAKEGALVVVSVEELREYLLSTICKREEKEEEKVEPEVVEKRKKIDFSAKRYYKKKVKDELDELEKIEAEEIVVVPKRRKPKRYAASKIKNKEGGNNDGKE